MASSLVPGRDTRARLPHNDGDILSRKTCCHHAQRLKHRSLGCPTGTRCIPARGPPRSWRSRQTESVLSLATRTRPRRSGTSAILRGASRGAHASGFRAGPQVCICAVLVCSLFSRRQDGRHIIHEWFGEDMGCRRRKCKLTKQRVRWSGIRVRSGACVSPTTAVGSSPALPTRPPGSGTYTQATRWSLSDGTRISSRRCRSRQTTSKSPPRRTTAPLPSRSGARRRLFHHQQKGSNGIVWSVAYSRSGSLLASGTEGGVVRLWDVRAGSLVAEF